jgi:hypothetical protein
MSRTDQVLVLKERLSELYIGRKSNNPITTFHVDANLFEEMAILFIAKHN